MNKILGDFKPAGVQHANYQKIKDFKVGTKLSFSWEHKNKFDPWAIRIEYEGVKIGYVPMGSDMQQLLHRYREAGIKILATLSDYKEDAHPWHMFTIHCEAERELPKPSTETNITLDEGTYHEQNNKTT